MFRLRSHPPQLPKKCCFGITRAASKKAHTLQHACAAHCAKARVKHECSAVQETPGAGAPECALPRPSCALASLPSCSTGPFASLVLLRCPGLAHGSLVYPPGAALHVYDTAAGTGRRVCQAGCRRRPVWAQKAGWVVQCMPQTPSLRLSPQRAQTSTQSRSMQSTPKATGQGGAHAARLQPCPPSLSHTRRRQARPQPPGPHPSTSRGPTISESTADPSTRFGGGGLPRLQTPGAVTVRVRPGPPQRRTPLPHSAPHTHSPSTQ